MSQAAHQICAKLLVFRSSTTQRCAQLTQIRKQIADNFTQMILFQCPLLSLYKTREPPNMEKSRKVGQTYRIPLPSPTLENRENYRKITLKFVTKWHFGGNFSFPVFRGPAREGNFVIFPYGVPSASKGKGRSKPS